MKESKISKMLRKLYKNRQSTSKLKNNKICKFNFMKVWKKNRSYITKRYRTKLLKLKRTIRY